ncbi:RBP1 protein, partial [Origma solitaria]|nr:RBP1 protein [Origma solitaria]
CFLLPTRSPSKHHQVNSGSLVCTPSSKEISPTKFPGLNNTIELSPPHNSLYEPPDIVSDDKEEHEKMEKGKFKKKEK